MFKTRSRAAVASINFKGNKFDSFMVIIGGSDELSALRFCELYFPDNDTYYSFPSLNIARENASVCVINNM
jgi:hypothetical protein